ncbi:MAG: hypothetical protein F2520_10410 [Actinobacteria bacterium]|uniref:Unannotated protein n=1 Tax=freshwater metagenome TaxID=449393 RepID=A0A6J5YFY3_9ZZZZ|nr:hypothetical protein [Actinomycetota bacterium]
MVLVAVFGVLVSIMATASPASSVTPCDAGSPPSAPSVTKVASGDSSVEIYFNLGCEDVETITINYLETGGAGMNSVTQADIQSPVTISGLTNGTPYFFQVQAANSNGRSPGSNTGSATPSTTPSAPWDLAAEPRDLSVEVYFQPGADGGAAITNYAYQLNGGSVQALSPAQVTAPVLIPGLTNGTTYELKLYAINANGIGAASAQVRAYLPPGVSVSFPPRTTPSAPTAVTASPGNGSASIAFTAGADGGAAISKYQVKVGSGAWTDAVGTSSPITVTGLTNYTTSSIQLRAVNSVGASTPSVAVTIRPKLTGPTIGVAYSSGKQGVQVGFAFARPANSTLAGFTVRAYAKDTTTEVSSCQTLPNGRSCYIPSLTSGAEYDIRVQAYFTLSGETKVRESLESATSLVRVNS